MSELEKALAARRAGIASMEANSRRCCHEVAEVLEQKPELRKTALAQVEEQLSRASSSCCRTWYEQWHEILTEWEMEKITDLLRPNDSQTEQLRSCAPFAGPDFRKSDESSSCD